MSCDFRVGDEVVCVDASAWRGPTRGIAGPPMGLREGATYTVKRLGRVAHHDDPCVWLAETRNVADTGYRAARFRKVERRTDKQSLTEWLKQPTDFEEPKRAPAKKRERAS